MTLYKRGMYEDPAPDEDKRVEEALAQRRICPRCGATERPALMTPPASYWWTVMVVWPAHKAPCGLLCLEGLPGHIGPAQFHLPSGCPKCDGEVTP